MNRKNPANPADDKQGEILQLRIVGSDIHHLVGRVARRIAEYLSPSAPSNPEIGRIAHELTSVLKRCTVTADVCGLQTLCDEGLSERPWGIQNVYGVREDGVWRYRIAAPEGADRFLADLVDRISALYASPSETPKAKQLLRAFVGSALLIEVGPYLFYSDLCGATDLCRNARIYCPWDEKNEKKR